MVQCVTGRPQIVTYGLNVTRSGDSHSDISRNALCNCHNHDQ